MLRRTLTQRAAAASGIDLPPTPLRAALLHRRVVRLLGGPLAASGGETAARLAKVYTDIAETKAKSAALPDGKNLALVGRAAALLSCGCLDDAAADLKAIGADGALARVSASLQVRVTTAKLAHLLRTQSVQGSEAWINPAGIAELQTQLGKDIERLCAVNNTAKDFVPGLLAAEAALNGAGSPSAACAAFDKLSDSMFTQEAQSFASEGTQTYAAMAFDAQRAWATEKALAAAGKFKSVVVGAGSIDKSKSLSTEESAALLQIAAWQEDPFVPINVLDMGDAAVAGYGPSESAAQMLLKVGHFLGLYSAHNAVAPHLDQLLANGFTKPGNHSTEAIEAALKNGKEGVLEQLAGYQCSRIGTADDAFATVNESMQNGYGADINDFSNLTTPYAETALSSLEQQLLRQARSRANVGLAAACASNSQLSKADQLLDDVIADGDYAELWRALLLKGNVAQKLGKVEESDGAFKALHQLKMQPEGRDLPLRDKHRDLSVF